MADPKPRIFVYRPHDRFADASGIAYAEDGEQVAHWVSSSHDWFRRDMGLHSESTRCHDLYATKYPRAYELVECVGRDALQARIDSGELRNVSFDPPVPAPERRPDDA